MIMRVSGIRTLFCRSAHLLDLRSRSIAGFQPAQFQFLRCKTMEKLITSFEEVKILIDGRSVPDYVCEGRKPDVRCPDVLGRYQMTVFFVPDGKEH